MVLDDVPQECRHLIHDRDTCFLPFDEIVDSESIEIVKTPPGTPQCNAFAERHVREIRETLDDMILMGERHLHYVLKKIEKHHNQQRPHQGIGNNIIDPQPQGKGEVVCHERLGGLLKSYRRAA